jgi:HEAT repeat protein
MKSTSEQLVSRGFLSVEEAEKYRALPEEQLVDLLCSANPAERTAAARVLSESGKKEYLPLFCEGLKTETKLYTKIELCEAIGSFADAAIPFLVPLLGTIGTNQHTQPVIADLGKKCYPLPRDIAARILMRLGSCVLPEMERCLEEGDRTQKSEAIDVIGYTAWNFGDVRSEKKLLDLYAGSEDSLIRWKIVRAFQSFGSKEVVEMLSSLAEHAADCVIQKEARRSLDRIAQRSTGATTPEVQPPMLKKS